MWRRGWVHGVLKAHLTSPHATTAAPMTAEKMPMMLDDPMAVDLNDVDDLFGDTVGLSLPVRPDNKNLLLRTDDLRRRGCSQYDTSSPRKSSR